MRSQLDLAGIGKGVKLPIFDIRETLIDQLREHRRFVLKAPTGSGKSTQVPQFLLDGGLLGERGQVWILQPRRVAARMLARRVAQERGGKPGDEVGHHIRLERLSGPRTRILYVTEGLLVRRLMEDRQLKGVAALLFDEFHERHIDGDLGLACALEVQRKARPDLILGVMSATLEVDFLEPLLAPCARIESEGRSFPVEIRYQACAPAGKGQREPTLPEQAARVLTRLTREGHEGDGLIFMPGAAEIYQTLRALGGLPELRGALLLPLHGELSADEQERVFADSSQRKVIVATNVAETSLTIPGVTLVIDAGQARIPDYDPRRDLNTLLVRPISQASADQRAGRAGRTAPGLCVRLWSQHEHRHRAVSTAPEIARLDLAETVLCLKRLGYADCRSFPWIEAPPEAHLQRAEQLLFELGALAKDGGLSPEGLLMAGFPLPPRHARFFLAAAREGCLNEALLVAAFAQGRPLLLSNVDKAVENAREKLLELVEHPPWSDQAAELRAFEQLQAHQFSPTFARQHGLHAEAARQGLLLARQFASICRERSLTNATPAEDGALDHERDEPPTRQPNPEASLNRALLLAYRDRLAVRLDRGTLRCGLVHGRKGFRRRESLVDQPLFICTEIEERDVKGQVQVMLGMNAAIDESWLKEFFPEDFREREEVFWDAQLKRVLCRRERLFGDLPILREESLDVPEDLAAGLLATEIACGRLPLKAWDEDVETWIRRVNFVARHWPEYEVSPIGTEERQLLLEQFCHGALSHKDLSNKDLRQTLNTWLTTAQQPLLESCAPEKFLLPSGFAARLRYAEDGTVILRATIQKLYDAPPQLLVGGRVAARIELLAPNQRPVHITDNLAGFWEGAYIDIRKQLRGRYPKHQWR